MKWFDVGLATLEEAEEFQIQPGTFQNKAKKRNQHNELILPPPKKHLHPQTAVQGVPVASIFANLLKGKLFALVFGGFGATRFSSSWIQQYLP